MVFDLDFERLIEVVMNEEYARQVDLHIKSNSIKYSNEIIHHLMDYLNVCQYLFDHVMLLYRIDERFLSMLLNDHWRMSQRDNQNFGRDQMW